MNTTRLLSDNQFEAYHELAGYILLEPIGSGGEAKIWSAIDQSRNQLAAVKLIPKVEIDRYYRAVDTEAVLIKNLDHPYIAGIYDSGTKDDLFYLVSPFFPLGSLENLLRGGPLDPLETLKLAAQIVLALDYIHSRNIVHRDIKPSNILLDAKKRAYITDFGLARLLSHTTQAFHTGHGTPVYSPPEQHTQDLVGPASDIYSLGITLFQVFTGDLPWGGTTSLAIRQMNTGENLPDPRRINPHLPQGLVDALRQITAFESQARPQKASDAFLLVAQTFRDYQFHPALSTTDLSTPEQFIHTILQPTNSKHRIFEDAEHIIDIEVGKWKSSPGKFGLSLSEYVFVDLVYSAAGQEIPVLSNEQREFMLHGALVYGYHHRRWWDALNNLTQQVQVCERVMINENHDAIERALISLLEAPPTESVVSLPQTMIAKLIDLAHKTQDPTILNNALMLLKHGTARSEEWHPFQFSMAEDIKLAEIATGSSPHALYAAQIIGHIRSRVAVQTLWDAAQKSDAPKRLTPLSSVLESAGSLPASLPVLTRLSIWLALVQRQLFAERPTLIRSYLLGALGCALSLGLHTFLLYNLPSFLDSARFLNALGSGLLFGPIIGLGIFLAWWITSRLQTIRVIPRVLLGTAAGMLIINIGVVSYHLLFLGTTTAGGLIPLGSAFISLGFSLGTQVENKFWRALPGAGMIFLSLALTWWLAQLTNLSPIMYYQLTWTPVQTVMLMFVSSLLIGIAGSRVDLKMV